MPNAHIYRTVRGTILALLLLSATYAPAAAQEGTWSITPMAGVAEYRDSTSAIGVSGGVHLTSRLALEADFLVMSNLFPETLATTFRAYWLGGNLVVRLRDVGWSPFAVGGFGLGRVVVDHDSILVLDQVRTEIAFNLGGGVTFPLSKRVSLRSDFRWLAIYNGVDEFYNITRLTGGVGFHF